MGSGGGGGGGGLWGGVLVGGGGVGRVWGGLGLGCGGGGGGWSNPWKELRALGSLKGGSKFFPLGVSRGHKGFKS